MSQHALAGVAMLAPLVGFLFAFVAFRRRPIVAQGVVLTTGLCSLVSALWVLAGGAPTKTTSSLEWMSMHEGGQRIALEFGVMLDGRSMLMAAIVALVTFCVLVYSLSYMASDPGRGRFFAFLGLFEWAMLSLVYAPNLLQTFIFWELVGLASFLLIGFWYRKPEAIAAAKKAFLMTRIGDVGLLIGLILLFKAGNTLDIATINRMSTADMQVNLIVGLLFVGIVGKSAQFPLHTWLPDAMEGPTPVSALLHSATMVAAGVFLFARFHELFVHAETAMVIALAIATFTALLASTMALVAKDMKRVLAYSSISQLGFMLMALASGTAEHIGVANAALFAGFFHLATHALFKALLFLCAGAYIHHYNTNDMIAMGRKGARSMKLTTLGLIVGGAGLAGLPPLAGFFSKESVIGVLDHSGRTAFLIAAYAASFLTAYYTFRMVFFILRPNAHSAALPADVAPAAHAHDGNAAGHDASHGHDASSHGHDASSHGHGSHEPLPLIAPIVLLTAGVIAAGWFGDQLGELLRHKVHHPGIADMAPAITVALFGVALAYWDFGRKAAAQRGFIARVPALEKLFANGWYIDAFYRATFVRGAKAVARLLFGTEAKLMDGGSDALARSTLQSGMVMAKAQTGRLQLYVGLAALVIGAISFAVGVW